MVQSDRSNCKPPLENLAVPNLDFKGKWNVYAHHMGVPYRSLVTDAARSLDPAKADDNLIVHGDNLEALKALLPRYAGRVKCIYIDPPYNTGNEGWVYNDKVNSPLMRAWLAQTVDSEDLERHDKWLCMMWPRLQLLREMLADDGAIFVSIDNNEQHHLRMLMDEIFGETNFIVEIIWRKRSTPPNDKIIGADHDIILVYANNIDSVVLNLQLRSESQTARYKNPDNHPRGPWVPGDLMANVKGGRYVESLAFPITNPATGQVHYPGQNGNWRFSQETIQRLLGNDEIWFGTKGNGRPKLKRFLSDVKEGVTYPSIWDFVPMNTVGSSEMQMIFGDSTTFENPKPEGLIREVLRLGAGPNDLVLDSFAGSGTTAHAVLALNKEDGGNRRFILVECEEYADSITAERVRRVIRGVPNAKDAALREGLDGSFTYCTLGEPIEPEGMLTADALPAYASLAAYLLLAATGASAGEGALQERNEDGLFHETETVDYYLIYRPDTEWLRSNEAVLTEERAERIGERNRAQGKKAVVFAAEKFMGQEDLTDLGVTFCRLPDELPVRRRR